MAKLPWKPWHEREKGTGTFATGIAAVWVSSCLEPAGVRWRRAAHGSVLERIPMVKLTIGTPNPSRREKNPRRKENCSAGQQRHATPTHSPQTVATNVPVPFASPRDRSRNWNWWWRMTSG